jgi:hypothetical protein
MLRPVLIAAALTVGAGAAHAQGMRSTPTGSYTTTPLPPSTDTGDTSDRDILKARDDAVAKARDRAVSKHVSGVPAKPGDVAVGSEVRDSKGALVGVIESVSMGAAVLKADGGAVAVPLEAFGKNGRGLLIGMPKDDFDKLVAEANKPAG